MSFDTLVFDFNGTIIDDLDFCVDVLNDMLTKHDHKAVTKQEYLDVFTFPIIEYYRKAGFLFPPLGTDDFEELAVDFDTQYNQGFKDCQMFEDIIPFLKKYQGKKRLIVLSATKTSTLLEELKQLKILSYFDGIIGTDDIYGASKLDQARRYFSSNPYNPDSTLFIGDTLHDQEVGKDLKGKTALIYRGHQSKSVLEKGKPDFLLPTIEDLIKVKE